MRKEICEAHDIAIKVRKKRAVKEDLCGHDYDSEVYEGGHKGSDDDHKTKTRAKKSALIKKKDQKPKKISTKAAKTTATVKKGTTDTTVSLDKVSILLY